MGKKKKLILAELDELDMEPASIISSNRPVKEGKKKDKDKEAEKARLEQEAEDEWLSTISSFKVEPIKRKGKRKTSIFDYYSEDGKKKKKKKKKKDGELTDYNKEFENETAILKNLLIDQNRFVEDLQKKYNLMEVNKSAAKGVGKFTTDLIASINSGRSVSMQIINNLISTKKTIADLSMKEKKEMKSVDGDIEDMNLYSAKFLKQMLNEGRTNIMGGDYDIVEDGDSDDLFEDISENLDIQNNEEVDKYLKYEKEDVTVYAIEEQSTGEVYFEARNSNDEVISDYPLPKVEGININRSTNIATDKYSRKYPVEYI